MLLLHLPGEKAKNEVCGYAKTKKHRKTFILKWVVAECIFIDICNFSFRTRLHIKNIVVHYNLFFFLFFPQKWSWSSRFCRKDPKLQASADLTLTNTPTQTVFLSHNQTYRIFITIVRRTLQQAIIFLLHYSNYLFRFILHKTECLQKDKTHFIHWSHAMHWGQSVECVACIHLVTLSRSCSEVQMEVHCWLLQHPFMLNNKQSEMIHISFSTVLFGCLMDAVVLNSQASTSSRLSTRGTARCTLFSLWRRTLPWFLQSPTAATGNI